jgi:Glyoxalase-like domain
MSNLAQLDHTVINVRFDMDKAEACFRKHGFYLTDRGYHSLGSINHLMMFGTDYIELIALPPENKDNPGRQDIAKAPFGINGLVFKTNDVDETFAHLSSIGMAGDPPKSFTRPVTTVDGTFDASFRTAHTRPGIFPGGRVYFCEHGTPDLVWRPEWQEHQNGAKAMPEFVVVSREPSAEAENFAKLLKVTVEENANNYCVKYENGFIQIMPEESYRDRYGSLASPLGDRKSIFGAIVIRTDDLDKVRSALDDTMTATVENDRVVIRVDAFDSVLEFIA